MSELGNVKAPCPFCGRLFSYHEAIHYNLEETNNPSGICGTWTECPHCHELVMYSLEILPNPGKVSWGKSEIAKYNRLYILRHGKSFCEADHE